MAVDHNVLAIDETRTIAGCKSVRSRPADTFTRSRVEEIESAVGADAEPEISITKGSVIYASIVAFIAWTLSVYDFILFGVLCRLSQRTLDGRPSSAHWLPPGFQSVRLWWRSPWDRSSTTSVGEPRWW